MKPQDLFIGIRDFLALLVPGCVLLLLWPVPLVSWLLDRSGLGSTDSTLRIFILLIASLAIGTFLSGLAGLMDYGVDAVLRKKFAKTGQKGLRGWIKGEITSLQLLQSRAQKLELEMNPFLKRLKPENRPWKTRSFWWNYLRLNCAAAIAELDRIEGLQKQFRSFVVVALILAALAFVRPSVIVSPDKRHPWGLEFVSLHDPWPWLTSLGAILTACACLVAYANYRATFSRRLFELAIIHAIPKNALEDGFRGLFANRSGKSSRAGRTSRRESE
jgi:hypothetical protein